jgi:hypothetical protein
MGGVWDRNLFCKDTRELWRYDVNIEGRGARAGFYAPPLIHTCIHTYDVNTERLKQKQTKQNKVTDEGSKMKGRKENERRFCEVMEQQCLFYNGDVEMYESRVVIQQ